MRFLEEYPEYYGGDQRHEHVPLFVPRAAPGAQSGEGAVPRRRAPPAIFVISSAAQTARNTRLTKKNSQLPGF
jgi:hypothetical protein